MNEILLEGKPWEIGFKHGRTLSSQIRSSLEIYVGMWGIPEREIPRAVSGYKHCTQDYFPHLAEEIEGIATGARVPNDLIYAINARTELIGGRSMQECTSFGLNQFEHEEGDVLLGQNWDWNPRFRQLTQVVEVRPTHGPRMKMLIEAGMVGKIGLNESGLGVCMNYLRTNSPKDVGIPVHVILRKILEHEDYHCAATFVKDAPRAANTNYLVGDKNGLIRNLEATVEGVPEIMGSPIVTHANSFNAQGEYCDRQRSFDETIASHPYEKISTQDAKRFLDVVRFPQRSPQELAFFDNLRFVVLNTPLSHVGRAVSTVLNKPYPKILYGRAETRHSLLMNLTQLSLEVSSGHAPGAYTTYYLK